MDALHVGFGFAVLAFVFLAIALLGRLGRAVGTAEAAIRVRDAAGKLVDLEQRSRLVERRDALGEELRTIEVDFRLGRIDGAAYEAERRRLEPLIVAVLRELDRLDAALDEAA